MGFLHYIPPPHPHSDTNRMYPESLKSHVSPSGLYCFNRVYWLREGVTVCWGLPGEKRWRGHESQTAGSFSSGVEEKQEVRGRERNGEKESSDRDTQKCSSKLSEGEAVS